MGFPDSSAGKESASNAGNPGSIFGLGRSPGERNCYPFQFSAMENSMNRGAWLAIVYRIAKSQTWLKRLSTSKKFAVLCYWWKILHFLWTSSGCFLWVLLSVGLIWSSTCWNQSFDFLEGVHNRGFLSNFNIYTSPSLAEDLLLV